MHDAVVSRFKNDGTFAATNDKFRHADNLIGSHGVADNRESLVSDSAVRHQIVWLLKIDPFDSVGWDELLDVDRLHGIEGDGIQAFIG